MLPLPEDMPLIDGILSMYREGWFPMAGMNDDPQEIEWTQPHERCLIPLDERFHVPRSLLAKVRQRRFSVTSDQAFAAVIRACAQPRAGEGDWLTEDIVDAYVHLYNAGHAHSVEAWLNADGAMMLVGGLYGLAVGSIFCGESMFSRPELGGTDASKVCTVHLVNHLRRQGFVILDSQIANAHTTQFGAYEIPAQEYLKLLEQWRDVKREWRPFTNLQGAN